MLCLSDVHFIRQMIKESKVERTTKVVNSQLGKERGFYPSKKHLAKFGELFTCCNEKKRALYMVHARDIIILNVP